MNEFEGLTAIVTGGGSGLGAAIAAELEVRGARVAVLDLRPGDAHVGVVCDVSDDASVRAAVEQAADELGGIDIVVNNAGIGAAGAIDGNDEAEWHRVWDINVVGIMRVSRAALPWLRRSEHAVIVNTASIAATRSLSLSVHASSNKFWSLSEDQTAFHNSYCVTVSSVPARAISA